MCGHISVSSGCRDVRAGFSSSMLFFPRAGLYEKHKPMYRLLLALKIQLNGGKILQDEFNALLRGGGALDLNSVRKKVSPLSVIVGTGVETHGGHNRQLNDLGAIFVCFLSSSSNRFSLGFQTLRG